MRRLALLMLLGSLGAGAQASNSDWRGNGTLAIAFRSTSDYANAGPGSGWLTHGSHFSTNCIPGFVDGAWSEKMIGTNCYEFDVHQAWVKDWTASYQTLSTFLTQCGVHKNYQDNNPPPYPSATRWAHFKLRFTLSAPVYHQAGWFYGTFYGSPWWQTFSKPTSTITLRVKHELQFKYDAFKMTNYVRNPSYPNTNKGQLHCEWQGWFNGDGAEGNNRFSIDTMFVGGDASTWTPYTANKDFGKKTLGWNIWKVQDPVNTWKDYKTYTINASQMVQVGTAPNGQPVYEYDFGPETLALYLVPDVTLVNAKGKFTIDVTASAKTTLWYP